MRSYGNVSGDSGVRAYELGADFIRVQFKDRGPYTYSYRTAGRAHVETMKTLAQTGRGLSTYISRYVKDRYVH